MHVYFTISNYRLDTNTLNDKTYSTQPALGLPTKFDLPPWRPAVDEEFQLALDYEFVVQVQVKHGGM